MKRKTVRDNKNIEWSNISQWKPLTELNLVKLLWGSTSRKWFISNPFFFRILQPRSRHDLKYYARKASKTWLVQILW